MRHGSLLLLMLLAAGCAGSSRRSAPAPQPQKPEVSREGGESTPAPQPEEPVTKDWRYEQSLERGVAFLLKSQNRNGSWGSPLPERPYDIYTGGVNSFHAFGNASSALCCMALLAQPSQPTLDAALLKGYRYLVDAPDAVRVSGDTFYDVWAHAYMIEAFGRGLADTRLESLQSAMRRRAQHEVARLFKLQGIEGGFGYYDFGWALVQPTGFISTPMSTSAALVGLKAAQEAGIEIPEKGLRCAIDQLKRMRLSNGAFLYSTEHKHYPVNDACKIRGSLGRSQAGNCALFEWGQLPAEKVEQGLRTFFKEHIFIEIGRCRQFPHEAWYATAPYYYYFGHYYASRNLAWLDGDARLNSAARLARAVARSQFDDGSFWDYPLFGYTKAYGTGFGVLIMSNCRQHLAQKH
jgi:hypothetical protein